MYNASIINSTRIKPFVFQSFTLNPDNHYYSLVNKTISIAKKLDYDFQVVGFHQNHINLFFIKQTSGKPLGCSLDIYPESQSIRNGSLKHPDLVALLDAELWEDVL